MKNRFLASLIGGGAVLALSSLTVLAASSGRASNIKSYGVSCVTNDEGQSVLLDSSDLIYLANEIDDLEITYKGGLLSAIQTLPSVASNAGLSSTQQSQARDLNFASLCDVVKHSQDVSTGTTANNLSRNYAAWINGTYVVGNGADNDAAYNQGYSEGYAHSVSSANIVYTYHQHVNGAGTIQSASTLYTTTHPGGCYVSAGHTHDKTGTCGYTQNVGKWYMVEEASWGDGSWTKLARCSLCGATHRWGQSCVDGQLVGNWDDSVTIGSTHCIGGKNYTCGYPVNTYVLGCGKTLATIEKAIITYG